MLTPKYSIRQYTTGRAEFKLARVSGHQCHSQRHRNRLGLQTHTASSSLRDQQNNNNSAPPPPPKASCALWSSSLVVVVIVIAVHCWWEFYTINKVPGSRRWILPGLALADDTFQNWWVRFALILTSLSHPQPWTRGSTPPKWTVIWSRCRAEGSLWGSGQSWRNTMLGRKVCHLLSGQNYTRFKQLLKNVKNQPCFLSRVSRTPPNTRRETDRYYWKF